MINDDKNNNLRFRLQYEKKIARLEEIFKQQTETEKHLLMSTWRWRLGNFQVNLAIKIRSLFRGIFDLLKPKPKLTKNFNTEKPVKITELNDASKLKQTNLPDHSKPNIACIFDTFTFNCFKPEFNIISPTPDNWKYVIEQIKTDAFICETAWKGNNMTWQNYIGDKKEHRKHGLIDLIKKCREKGIPTVFWNKEDPVHYDHFIDDARQFDYIFTTDSDKIQDYIKQSNHNRVYNLPFAAQEQIHNPVRQEPREGNVCFAGTYYNHRYPLRVLDMETVLDPAMDFGLVIYDRNYGATGHKKLTYSFPEKYQPFINGSLEYSEMVNAYKMFKVFLNTNSVRFSPTMLARRVFELLACGTPVISTYSEAIVNLFGEETVFMTETEEETRGHLEKLLNDDHYWWKSSLKGMRLVMEQHTYSHRSKEIFKRTGIKFSEQESTHFILLSKVENIDDARYLGYLLNRQRYRDFELIMIEEHDKVNQTDKDDIIKTFESNKIKANWSDHASSLQYLGNGNRDYIVIFNIHDYYGPNYLRDYALALRYAGAEILGKASFNTYSSSNSLVMQNKGLDFQYINRLTPGTLVFKPPAIENYRLNEIINSDSFESNKQMLAIDPWSYIKNGRYASEQIKKMTDL